VKRTCKIYANGKRRKRGEDTAHISFTYETQLSDIWKMARGFLVPYLAAQRFLWLVEPFTMDNFEGALELCINSFPGMLCYRLDIWAQWNNVLSPTQYGFRKKKGTRDCLTILTTDINNSFEMKKQAVAAF
jgi:hypothetical protein